MPITSAVSNRSLMMNNMKGRPILYLLFLGLIIRVVFVFFVARPYFGRDNIHVDGDTYSFAWAFQNLYETGTYTVNPSLEYGYFGRMPGYPFFIGAFYLLTGQNWDSAFVLIAWIQLVMDLLTGWLLYLIVFKLSVNRKTALIALFLYMTYPFVIVWTPVIYAETTGVFLTVATLYFFLTRESKRHLLYAGIIAGCGVLVRPQGMVLAAVMAIILIMENTGNRMQLLRSTTGFLLPLLLIYGSWPLRNYVNHHKAVLTHDLRGFYNWNEDVLAFWNYVYAVKSEWDPQYTQIITNQKVTWPKAAYLSKEDSLMLEKAVFLAQHCGSGFSHKRGYWKESFDTPNCNEEIKAMFVQLRKHQIKNNPWNFYFKVPLENLKKALFKTKLNDAKSLTRKLSSLLFYYRSFLIIIGLLFYLLLFKNRSYRNLNLLLPVIYFIFLYAILCGGTSVPLRNIEMRYFLPADVILIIPASFFIQQILSLKKNKHFKLASDNL
jgi:uncharacterized membrane protein YqjE